MKLGSWCSELYTRSPPGSHQTDNHSLAYTPNSVFTAASGNGLQFSVAAAARTLSKVNSNNDVIENIHPSQMSRAAVMRLSNNYSGIVGGGRESSNRNGSRIRRAASTAGATSIVNENLATSNITQTWEESQAFVIQCYQTATLHAPDCRNTWQSWAMANYAVFNHLDTLKACLERAELELNKASINFSCIFSILTDLCTTFGVRYCFVYRVTLRLPKARYNRIRTCCPVDES